MQVELFCPLGRQCEEAVDGAVRRCRWYRGVKGMDPQSGQVTMEWDCAVAASLKLELEIAKTNRGQSQALEKFICELRNGLVAIARIAIEGKNTGFRLPFLGKKGSDR
jgi:hypothetical protein